MKKTEIGALVRLHREKAGLSLQGLADLAQLTKDVVYRVENARGSIGEGALQKIANALGIVIPREPIMPDSLKEDDEK